MVGVHIAVGQQMSHKLVEVNIHKSPERLAGIGIRGLKFWC